MFGPWCVTRFVWFQFINCSFVSFFSFVSIALHPSVYFSFHSNAHLHFSDCLFVCLHTFICPLLCLYRCWLAFVHLSVCSFVCLFICLFVHSSVRWSAKEGRLTQKSKPFDETDWRLNLTKKMEKKFFEFFSEKVKIWFSRIKCGITWSTFHELVQSNRQLLASHPLALSSNLCVTF